ncbi:MAG: A/G-specific adenine glycosylase [Bacteroidales bacterium]|nr:A/G-specific adenine glycosylase [Bacteroidales bacterium]
MIKNLIDWYSENKRELPWRGEKDPYKIWISEIILQQTRIEQGLNYYYSFIESFPDVFKLAEAPQEKVLRLWQGLGYYSRARNLHQAAKEIVDKYNGRFPKDYQKLLGLKGIGPYTAAAIASIAFELPFPVLDGNVARFLSRLYGVQQAINSTEGQKLILGIANELIANQKPSVFNQAMMEMGALICKPQPQCNVCPLTQWCFAWKHKCTDMLPVKIPKKKPYDRYLNYFVFQNKEHSSEDNSFIIRQRKEDDVWKDMYDFPCYESKSPIEPNDLLSIPIVNNWLKISQGAMIKYEALKPHKLTHQTLHITMYYFAPCRLLELIKSIPDTHITNPEKFEHLPKPKPFIQKKQGKRNIPIPPPLI